MTAKSSSTRLKNFFNDSYTYEEYTALVGEVTRELYRILKNDSAAYVFINWKSYPIWYLFLQQAGFSIKNLIIWDKVVHGLNYQNYAYRHEFCIFGVKGHFLPTTNSTPNYRHDVWKLRRDMGKSIEMHETMKPVELVKIPIMHATDVGDTVLDPFLGSGTTALAAKLLGRHYIGIEREKEYVDIAQARVDHVNNSLAI